jgi:putative flippase GtrA
VWRRVKRLDVRETLRFGAVGLAHNGVNLATYTCGLWIGFAYPAAAAMATCVALGFSFVANRHWTFAHARNGRARHQAARYVAVFAAAGTLTLGLLTLLVELADVPAVAAQAIAIMLAAPVSYVAQRSFTFRRSA